MLLPLIASLIFTTATYADAITVVFSDEQPIPKPIQVNGNLLVNQNITIPESISTYRADQLSYAIARLLEEAAQPFGYFNMQCEVHRLALQPKVRYQAHCHLNQPVHVTAVETVVTGPGKQLLERDLKTKSLPLKEGDVFQTSHYDQVKNSLLEWCYHSGYLNASTQKSRLIIDPKKRTAQAYIHVDTGTRYLFGSVHIVPTTYNREFLRKMAPYDSTTPYSDFSLSNYRETLESSNLFSYVSVLPDIGKRTDQHIPTIIHYEPIPKLQYGLGAGFSSGNSFFYSAGIQRNRLTTYGTKATVELLSSREYSFALGALNIPKTHPTRDFYTIQIGYRHEDIDYVGDDRNITTSLGHTKQIEVTADKTIRFERALNYTIDRSSFDGEPTNKNYFLYPSLQYDVFTRDPKSQIHFSALNSLKANFKALLAPTNFAKITSQQRIIIPNLPWENSILLRTKQGYIANSNTKDLLPLSWYFYTGGATSVRGFAYNSIGASAGDGYDDNNYLYTLSLELQHRLYQDIYSIAFIDCGDASRSLSHTRPSYAVGSGLVWKSFAGNFEISLAKPIRNYSSDKSMSTRLNINLYQPLYQENR